MRACPNKECDYNGRRFYTNKFCPRCGTATAEIVMCCKDEDMIDTGFCPRCGTKKSLKFAEVKND